MDEKNSQLNPLTGQPYTDEELQLVGESSQKLISSFSHSLDSKGRLIIPAVYRDFLGDKFYIGPSFDFKSVTLYPTIVWARFHKRYEQLGTVNPKARRYLEMFDSLSFRDMECDGQGRVLLPTKLRQRILKDAKDVDVSGAADCVNITVREEAELDYSEFVKDLPGMLDSFGSTAMPSIP